MSRLTSIHSRPSTAAFSIVCWTLSFPLVAKLWRELIKDLFDFYRPELHYMRGPGPRWREKHAAASLHPGSRPRGDRRGEAAKVH
jgi:hypothetical protein